MSGSHSQAARVLPLTGDGPAGTASDLAMPDRDFALLRKLIYREAGIHLPSSKKQLLTRRLSRRLKALQLDSFGAYYRRVSAPGAGDERTIMLDCVTTNETRFFRESRQFELLEEDIIPRWRESAEAGRRAKRIRAWSAACSTGQEPYSLAMVLSRLLPATSGWQVEVLASDLSTEAVEVAKAAIWPIEQISDIPERFLKPYMMRGKGPRSGEIKAAPELRSVVRCRRFNLHRGDYAALGTFDLILCRNVLIYFDRESSAAVLDRLLRQLAPDGYLFGGHAENLTSLSNGLRALVPTVYQPAEARGGVG